jgi:hypothetical protein
MALEMHAELCFPHGTKQQLLKFWSHAQSHSPLCQSTMLQIENCDSGAESFLCAAVCELDCRLDVCHVTKGAHIRHLSDIRRAVKKFLEFPCRRRMSDKIVHTLLWWGARHVCSQAQQVWTGYSVQCHYCSVWIRCECWSFSAMSQFEQRANIKFMCILGKSASKMLSALQPSLSVCVCVRVRACVRAWVRVCVCVS